MSATPREATGTSRETPDSGHFSRDIEVQWRGHHPSRIGPYRIVEILGTGGMGTVYLAEQTRPVHRRVALKLLDRRFADETSEQRFRAECQALARMRHPGIAHFYGAGITQDGHSFLVLEHVDGPSIVDYCDQRRLSVEARLGLFRGVCDAVQHAHQKAIIHRDLKPGNVLVEEIDGAAVPKVIDFGIAQELHTAAGKADSPAEGLVGTPLYLSPEAILATNESEEPDAGLDTRSDVYALGMLLYKLLVGVLPLEHEQGNVVRILRQIVEQDLPLASVTFQSLSEPERTRLANLRATTSSGLDRQLQGEVDWILRAATHRDRDHRYGSVAEFSNDLDLHMRGLPLSVGPPRRLYATRKFVRRNRTSVALAASALLTLTLGTIGLAGLYRQSTAAARQAQQEAEAAQQVSKFLVDLFAAADPTGSTGETSARDLLDRGARLIRENLREQPAARADLLLAIGKAYTNLQERDSAEPMLTEALDLLRQEHGEQHPEVADALQALGFLRWTQGREDEAEQLLLRALEIQEDELGWNSVEVVETLSQIAGMLGQSGRLDEAEVFLRRAIEAQAVQPAVDLRLRATNLLRMGSLNGSQGNTEDAQSYFESALALFQELYGPDHPVIGDVQSGLCSTLRQLERLSEAEVSCQRSLDIRLAQLGPEHVKTSQSQLNLAVLEQDLGRFDRAESLLRAALDVRQRHLPPDHPRTLSTQQSLAVTLGAQATEHPEKGEEAIRLFEDLLSKQLNSMPRDHPQRQQALSAFADLLRHLQRDDEAVEIEGQILAPAPPVSESPEIPQADTPES